MKAGSLAAEGTFSVYIGVERAPTLIRDRNIESQKLRGKILDNYVRVIPGQRAAFDGWN